MVIKHNMSTQFATRQLNILEDTKGRATEKLTTGYRINKAADGAASMVVWESIRNQVKGLNQAGRNSQDGQGFINTADSGMNELTSILHRMKELCVQGANDTNTAEDREDIQMEIDALNSEINRIADETEFNTIKIFKDPYADADPGSDDWEPGGNGTEGNREFVFQVGANSEQLVRTRLPVFNTKILGTEGVNVSDSVNATSGLAVLDKSLDIVDLERSRSTISKDLSSTASPLVALTESDTLTPSVPRIFVLKTGRRVLTSCSELAPTWNTNSLFPSVPFPPGSQSSLPGSASAYGSLKIFIVLNSVSSAILFISLLSASISIWISSLSSAVLVSFAPCTQSSFILWSIDVSSFIPESAVFIKPCPSCEFLPAWLSPFTWFLMDSHTTMLAAPSAALFILYPVVSFSVARPLVSSNILSCLVANCVDILCLITI